MTKLLAGRYEVGRPLGSGSFGFVYEARDIRTSSGVALKVIPLTRKVDAQFRKRLAREIQHGYQVESDYVAKLLDLIVTNRQVVLVLELVQGRTLYSLLEEGNSPDVNTTINYGRQIASGIGALHERRIVHRDLKLENIALNQHEVIKILDLGSSIVASAVLMGGEEHRSRDDGKGFPIDRATERGRVVGTLHYMCPHYLTTGNFDHRADIYAFGVIMYELLCNKFPFEFSNPPELLQAKVEGVFTPLRELCPECPEEVARAIESAMSVGVEDRPPHIQVIEGIFAQELRSGLQVREHLVREERKSYRSPQAILPVRPLRFAWLFPLFRYLRLPLPGRALPGSIDYGHPTFFSSLYELLVTNVLVKSLLFTLALAMIVFLVARAERANSGFLQRFMGAVDEERNSNTRFFAPDPEKANSEVLKAPQGQNKK